MENEERKINKETAFIMVGVALFIDLIVILLNFIPGPGWIIIWLVNVIVWSTFYIWFKVKGVSFSTSRRALSLGGGLLIEMIPIIDILPAWTMAVVLIIRSSWKEDKEAAKNKGEDSPPVVGKSRNFM